MTDAISAYNARLEAMAAACDAEADDKVWLVAEEQRNGDPGTASAYAEDAANLRDAAARLRSQMLRPIEEAPPHMTIIVAVDGALEVGWKSDDGSIVLPPRIRTEPTHFLPLPQIGGEHE